MTIEVTELWGRTVSFLNQQSTGEHSNIGIYLDYFIPKALTSRELIVSTKNTFVKDRIERLYLPDIKYALFTITGIDLDFTIITSEQTEILKTPYQKKQNDPPIIIPSVPTPSTTSFTSPFVGAPVSYSEKSVTGIVVEEQKISEKHTLLVLEEHTFDSFVVAESNRGAFSAAQGVAKSPGTLYNPLFIYGESGLGKTHLLLAIENYINTYQPNLRTTYVQTLELVRDFTTMMSSPDKRLEFNKKYHQIDVLLLDDVQYLEGKIETTGEVFQIFEEFTARNAQIVMSADRAPYDINLDERFTSRFSRGITMDIQLPNYETKRAIFENYLNHCCTKHSMPDLRDLFSLEIIDHIIELSSDNIRELEGATDSLVYYLSQKKNPYEPLTIKEVEQKISNVFMRNNVKRIDIRLIQKTIEGYYKISHDDLLSKKRSHGISYPRQIAMYLARTMTSASLPDIGKAFGGKDHTSVLYAYNQIEQKRQLSKETERDIERLIMSIRK